MDSQATSYTALLLSLIIGAFYTLVIGFGTPPVNLQMTLYWIVLMGSVVILLREKGRNLNKFQTSLLIISSLIAIFSSITSNHLLVTVNSFSLFLTATLFLVGLFRQSGFPANANHYLFSLVKYTVFVFYEFLFGLILLKPLSLLKLKGLPKGKISKETGLGLILAVPILIVFHILFTLINSEYYHFTSQILEHLWRIIKYILDIDLIVFLLKTLITSYTYYILLTVSEYSQSAPRSPLASQLKKYSVILSTTIGLFALFSFFQSKLLLTNMVQLAFKTLSLYTQQGFWELILVSLLGYGLCLWVIHSIHKFDHQTTRIRLLLGIFVAELLLITIFSYHKLYWLQLIFGLKDQRILATSAVILITFTFILFLLRLYQRISPERIFSLQIIAFISLVCLLNIFNLDWIITKTYPISYYVNNAKYKDYSYLLGNSFDNYDQWLNLIREYEQVKPAQPNDYYWGWYEPICRMGYTYKTNRIDVREPISYLEDHYQYVYNKYSQNGSDLTILTQFNLHEYQVYLLLQKYRRDVFAPFLEKVKASCQKQVER